MEWKHLMKGKGKNVQKLTEEFRKKALNLDISLYSPEILTNYIGSLYGYIRHSLLFFEPTTIDEASVKAMHLKSREMQEKNDQPNKTTKTKRRGEKPSCTHCEKEGHEEENC